MIKEYNAKHFCKDDISLIENYDKAVADTTQSWHCHHKLEIHSDYTNSVRDLQLMNLYYNRPAEELIFLTHSEHTKLHASGKNHPLYSKHHSEETKRKLSKANTGKHPSEESRRKMSDSHKGAKNYLYGKHPSDETRKKISETLKGRVPWNKGKKGLQTAWNKGLKCNKLHDNIIGE